MWTDCTVELDAGQLFLPDYLPPVSGSPHIGPSTCYTISRSTSLLSKKPFHALRAILHLDPCQRHRCIFSLADKGSMATDIVSEEKWNEYIENMFPVEPLDGADLELLKK
mmetsp:Transcript_20/g.74  ORF Transcript_20/g.74 Transcript_20/m.74 type:complete len:110 (-) Transcript_20:1842-2171(-)